RAAGRARRQHLRRRHARGRDRDRRRRQRRRAQRQLHRAERVRPRGRRVGGARRRRRRAHRAAGARRGDAGHRGHPARPRRSRVSAGEAALARVEALLAGPDAQLAERYPGAPATRQPVHSVYVPAHRFDAATIADWGSAALDALDRAGGAAHLLEVHGLVPPGEERDRIGELVVAKLRREPIEDLRVDLEDGFGDVGDEAEDAAVDAAVAALADLDGDGALPPFVGIRFKCFEPPTRARGIRTLQRFVTGLHDRARLPEGLVLTLPKVTSVAQVEAMVLLLEALESDLALEPGRLGFEIQVETPQSVLGPDGTSLLPAMITAGRGRVTGMPYGTYDYSASLGIAAGDQSMEHPAADHAKAVMQVAAAGTGVRLSDGSTNVLPVGEPAAVD